MPLITYIKILWGTLLVALFVERYCFAVVVYKTENYGFILLIVTIFFNAIFSYFIYRLRKKKHIKKLREVYSVENEPSEGLGCVIGFVG